MSSEENVLVNRTPQAVGAPAPGAAPQSPAETSPRSTAPKGPTIPASISALALLLALATAFYMGLIPKQDYAYPLHVDEWIHLQIAETALDWGMLPFHPNQDVGGFHILLVELRALTGLDWFSLFRWFPPMTFSITVFLSYLVGRRFGCGLESAFLATLIPTTIRFLGPAFTVPVALGLLALPLLLYLLHSPEHRLRHWFLGTLTVAFMGVTHPTSAILLSLIVAVHAMAALAIKNHRSQGERVATALPFLFMVAVPFALAAWWRWDDVHALLKNILEATGPTALPPVRDAVSQYGFLPAGLFIVGALLLPLRGAWTGYALVGSALALLAVITIYGFTYLGYQSLADRSWLLLLLLMSLIGGYAVGTARRWLSERGLGWPRRMAAGLALALAVTVLVASVTTGLQRSLKEKYYRLVTDSTIADFQWIKQNLGPSRRTAVLKTDLAYPYLAVARGSVYAVEAWPFVNASGREAMGFLYGRPPSDGRWWRERGVSIIYAPHWSDAGPSLNRPRPGVFIPAPQEKQQRP